MKKLIIRFICILTIVGLMGCSTLSGLSTVGKVLTPQNIATANVVLKGIQAVYSTICSLAVQKADPTVMEVLEKTDKALKALGQIVIANQVPSDPKMSVAQAIYLGMEALVEITNIIAQ